MKVWISGASRKMGFPRHVTARRLAVACGWGSRPQLPAFTRPSPYFLRGQLLGTG